MSKSRIYAWQVKPEKASISQSTHEELLRIAFAGATDPIKAYDCRSVQLKKLKEAGLVKEVTHTYVVTTNGVVPTNAGKMYLNDVFQTVAYEDLDVACREILQKLKNHVQEATQFYPYPLHRLMVMGLVNVTDGYAALTERGTTLIDKEDSAQ